jgi:hypothetical protein
VTSDPRLPDPALASRRVYGDLRPTVNVPNRATITARRTKINEHGVLFRWTVYENRAHRRWWLEVLLIGSRASNYASTLHDYATTTSARRARGWVDAVNDMTANVEG